MAKLNRYDSPAESNYFNTFVPLPLDQITALGMKRQEDLERRQDVASKYIDEASMIDYIPGSKDEERVKNEFLPEIQRLAEEAMSVDLSNPVEWAKYSTRLKRLSLSDDIKRIEQSAAGYKQALAIAKEQRLKGVYNPLLDDTSKMARGWDSQSGIFDYTPESQINKSKLFEPYYQNIGQDYSSRVNVGTEENPLYVLRQGVSDSKIRAIGAKAAQDLAATGEGNQIVRLARMENPALYADMTDREILESQMYEYGKSRADFKDQILPEFAQGAGGGEPTNLISSWNPLVTGGTGKKLVQDPAGILKGGKADLLGDLTRSAVPGSYGYGSLSSDLAPIADYTAIVKEREEAYDKVMKMFPEFGVDRNGKELTKEETLRRYLDATTNQMGGSMYVSNDPKVNDYLNSMLDNRYKSYKYLIPGLDETFTDKELMDKLDIKESSDFRKAMTPAGPSFDIPEGMSIMISPKTNNRYAKAIKAAGNQVVAVGESNISNNLKGIAAIKNMVDLGQSGRQIIGSDGKYFYGVDISWKLGERNGREAFIPVYRKFRSKGKGHYEPISYTDDNGNTYQEETNMDEIFSEVADAIFAGSGTSPYDVNLEQPISSTGRRTVRSNKD